VGVTTWSSPKWTKKRTTSPPACLTWPWQETTWTVQSGQCLKKPIAWASKISACFSYFLICSLGSLVFRCFQNFYETTEALHRTKLPVSCTSFKWKDIFNESWCVQIEKEAHFLQKNSCYKLCIMQWQTWPNWRVFFRKIMLLSHGLFIFWER